MMDQEFKDGLPRIAEAAIALIALLLVAPLMLLAAALIAATSRGPIIFRQRRIGRGARPFVMYKFRTMRQSQDGPQVTARGDARVTRVGGWLRRTKIDELPELWNVLKGEMSLVGPRPEVPALVDLQRTDWRSVLRVRPGITDPITLRLRNEEELLAEFAAHGDDFYLQVLQPFKLKGYLEYQRRRSWLEDLKVLWRTGAAVILPEKSQPPTLSEMRAALFEKA